MIQRLREALNRILSSAFKKTIGLIPGGWITLITLLFDGYALYSGGLLGIGAISGVALCFSVLFILLATSKKIRDVVCRLITYYGAAGDVLMTATLTYFGFKAGPTAGMVALFLSLNLSMFFSVIRWIYFFNRPEEKSNFEATENNQKANKIFSQCG